MRNSIFTALIFALVAASAAVPAFSQQGSVSKQPSLKVVDLSSRLTPPPMPKADESVYKKFAHPEMNKQQAPASTHGRTVILPASARSVVATLTAKTGK